MNLESRVAALEAVIENQPDESAERLRALCDAVRREARIVDLFRHVVIAEQLGNSGAASDYQRHADASVYPLALEHLGVEAAEPFAPSCV